jgi:hypothetical protein
LNSNGSDNNQPYRSFSFFYFLWLVVLFSLFSLRANNEGSEMTNGASTILRNSILAKSMGKHQFLNAIMEILYSSSNDNDDNDDDDDDNEGSEMTNAAEAKRSNKIMV